MKYKFINLFANWMEVFYKKSEIYRKMYSKMQLKILKVNCNKYK